MSNITRTFLAFFDILLFKESLKKVIYSYDYYTYDLFYSYLFS